MRKPTGNGDLFDLDRLVLKNLSLMVTPRRTFVTLGVSCFHEHLLMATTQETLVAEDRKRSHEMAILKSRSEGEMTVQSRCVHATKAERHLWQPLLVTTLVSKYLVILIHGANPAEEVLCPEKSNYFRAYFSPLVW